MRLYIITEFSYIINEYIENSQNPTRIHLRTPKRSLINLILEINSGKMTFKEYLYQKRCLFYLRLNERRNLRTPSWVVSCSWWQQRLRCVCYRTIVLLCGWNSVTGNNLNTSKISALSRFLCFTWTQGWIRFCTTCSVRSSVVSVCYFYRLLRFPWLRWVLTFRGILSAGPGVVQWRWWRGTIACCWNWILVVVVVEEKKPKL